MHGLQAAMPTQGSIWNMNRKRPRPHWSGHLLLVLWITPMQAFVKPPVFRSLGFTTPRYCGRGARSQASPAVVLHDDNSGGDEKSDPLPRTMEELYRRMRMSPPVDLSAEYEQKPDDEDMVIIEKAIRYVCKPMEEESWWEENGEEWDRVMSNPKSIFGSITLDDEDNEDIGYDMLTEVLSTSPSYKLSSYKAGGHSNADLSLTPFAQYWDSLPDLRVSNRVYTYNVVDRMAALKSIMNCTFNGMHGSADCHQAGHFLWGYVDQLDWMRRSGRLSITPGSIKVDRGCWWGHVSFALTIVPLAAAVGSGVFDHAISFLNADELRHPEMQRAVRAWRRVWRYTDPIIAERLMEDMPVHDALQEGIRRAQWAAHVESLQAVETLYHAEFDALPSAEREFARGWCRAARLLGAAAADTSLDKLIYPLGAGYLPEHILERHEVAEGIKEANNGERIEGDFDSVVQRKTTRYVRAFRWLGNLPAPAFTLVIFFWHRACVSYPARRGAARALRRICGGGFMGTIAAVTRSLVFMLVPDLNYRKLVPPFGIDPVEEVEYDPQFKPRNPEQPVPRPHGSPVNPLQRPWYDGPKPQLREEGPIEDDDDGFGVAGRQLFLPGMEPSYVSFDNEDNACKSQGAIESRSVIKNGLGSGRGRLRREGIPPGRHRR